MCVLYHVADKCVDESLSCVLPIKNYRIYSISQPNVCLHNKFFAFVGIQIEIISCNKYNVDRNYIRKNVLGTK